MKTQRRYEYIAPIHICCGPWDFGDRRVASEFELKIISWNVRKNIFVIFTSLSCRGKKVKCLFPLHQVSFLCFEQLKIRKFSRTRNQLKLRGKYLIFMTSWKQLTTRKSCIESWNYFGSSEAVLVWDIFCWARLFFSKKSKICVFFLFPFSFCWRFTWVCYWTNIFSANACYSNPFCGHCYRI